MRRPFPPKRPPGMVAFTCRAPKCKATYWAYTAGAGYCYRHKRQRMPAAFQLGAPSPEPTQQEMFRGM